MRVIQSTEIQAKEVRPPWRQGQRVYLGDFYANGRSNVKYFDSAKDAMEVVESHGEGRVVLFMAESNLHGGVDLKSSAMWVLHRGEGWFSHAIFDGHGGKLKQEQPK